jgi:DNA (cytosine-5)-methyltransferase 1
MGRPRLLDLFCCAGGAGRGYADAGFDVVGVDVAPQPRYPFEFRRRDVLSMTAAEIVAEFDAIHASPPCQGQTRMVAPGKKEHANLIPATRALLEATGLPWIIENVEGAEPWMPDALTLCGTMFGLQTEGHELRRHRLFIASFDITAPSACQHTDGPVVGVYGGHARRRSAKHGGRGTRDVWVNGHRGAMGEAMGMDWATCTEMSEAIPPAYTRCLGEQVRSHIEAQRLAA